MVGILYSQTVPQRFRDLESGIDPFVRRFDIQELELFAPLVSWVPSSDAFIKGLLGESMQCIHKSPVLALRYKYDEVYICGSQ
jgi:hypothetical protein